MVYLLCPKAMEQLRVQAECTPPPQWIRVIGGWSEFQFTEGRLPSIDEINTAAPDTPVFILHLYDCALLNRAALRILGINKNSPNQPGGLSVRDASGTPTGLFIAELNAFILYSIVVQAPKLSFSDQINSTRHYMPKLNRFDIGEKIKGTLTSGSLAGSGGAFR